MKHHMIPSISKCKHYIVPCTRKFSHLQSFIIKFRIILGLIVNIVNTTILLIYFVLRNCVDLNITQIILLALDQSCIMKHHIVPSSSKCKHHIVPCTRKFKHLQSCIVKFRIILGVIVNIVNTTILLIYFV
jgi:hypothetical protein